MFAKTNCAYINPRTSHLKKIVGLRQAISRVAKIQPKNLTSTIAIDEALVNLSHQSPKKNDIDRQISLQFDPKTSIIDSKGREKYYGNLSIINDNDVYDFAYAYANNLTLHLKIHNIKKMHGDMLKKAGIKIGSSQYDPRNIDGQYPFAHAFIKAFANKVIKIKDHDAFDFAYVNVNTDAAMGYIERHAKACSDPVLINRNTDKNEEFEIMTIHLFGKRDVFHYKIYKLDSDFFNQNLPSEIKRNRIFPKSDQIQTMIQALSHKENQQSGEKEIKFNTIKTMIKAVNVSVDNAFLKDLDLLKLKYSLMRANASKSYEIHTNINATAMLSFLSGKTPLMLERVKRAAIMYPAILQKRFEIAANQENSVLNKIAHGQKPMEFGLEYIKEKTGIISKSLALTAMRTPGFMSTTYWQSPAIKHLWQKDSQRHPLSPSEVQSVMDFEKKFYSYFYDMSGKNLSEILSSIQTKKGKYNFIAKRDKHDIDALSSAVSNIRAILKSIYKSEFLDHEILKNPAIKSAFKSNEKIDAHILETIIHPEFRKENFKKLSKLYHSNVAQDLRYNERILCKAIGMEIKGNDDKNPFIIDNEIYLGDAKITPILTINALFSETEEMDNCVADYSTSVSNGTLYVFSIKTDSERSTLGVKYNKARNAFVTHQNSGYSNAAISLKVQKIENEFLYHLNKCLSTEMAEKLSLYQNIHGEFISRQNTNREKLFEKRHEMTNDSYEEFINMAFKNYKKYLRTSCRKMSCFTYFFALIDKLMAEETMKQKNSLKAA